MNDKEGSEIARVFVRNFVGIFCGVHAYHGATVYPNRRATFISLLSTYTMRSLWPAQVGKNFVTISRAFVV